MHFNQPGSLIIRASSAQSALRGMDYGEFISGFRDITLSKAVLTVFLLEEVVPLTALGGRRMLSDLDRQGHSRRRANCSCELTGRSFAASPPMLHDPADNVRVITQSKLELVALLQGARIL